MNPNKIKKILIADDEPDILEIIGYNLQQEGYHIFTAKDGEDALQKMSEINPDLVILDIMMPQKTGLDVCKIIRSKPAYKDTLITFLTAMNDEASHIHGLDNGADDYITKPISPKVLVSRVNSLFRRITKKEEHGKVLKLENISIDPVKFSISVDNSEILLAKKEFELLYLLASEPRRVFLRNEILDHVWGSDVIVGGRTIDVHIRKIRQKLGIDCVTTVKGVGYKFELGVRN